jgi:hypothetical protein
MQQGPMRAVTVLNDQLSVAEAAALTADEMLTKGSADRVSPSTRVASEHPKQTRGP